MPAINANNLKFLRQRKNWSLDELSHLSKIDRGTISRIETGKQVGKRHTTVKGLADAFGIEEEILTGADIASAGREWDGSAKSLFTFKMENSARNALELVSKRYEVKMSHIMHLAPLLFLWAAEESLKRRQESMETLIDELDAIEKPDSLRHLNGSIASNWRGEEALESERQSISKRDLFGLELDGDSLREDYDEYEQNPMAQFLRKLSESLDGLSQFEFWYPTSEPHYWLCEDAASAMVDGDVQAANSILHGHAPLHELPKALREGGPAQVALWAKERAEMAESELLASFNLGGQNGL